MKKKSGVFLSLLTLGLVGTAVHKINENNKENEARMNMCCDYSGPITYPIFEQIVQKNAKRIKRISEIRIDGPIIRGTVESNSGLSEWKFRVDFNDYGKISGAYWVYSENDDSIIPSKLGKGIQSDILDIIGQKNEKSAGGHKKKSSSDNLSLPATVLILLLAISFIVAPVLLYYYDFDIFDYYSEEKTISMASDDMIGKNYEVVGRLFENSGFTNIQYEKHDDVILGVISEIGEVESVSINNDTSFIEGDIFPSDSKVVIKYHTRIGDK